ncbi:MAG: hypothetical protein ABIH40_04990 [Candidatus Omnitrophota bacterium]
MMKRYKATNFFIDCIRNTPIQQDVKEYVASRYGDLNLEEKFRRYISFKPPSLRIITEYHDLLQEIEDSYVYGLYYPSLTSACCLGERIFNILILKLRDYYKRSEHYKHVYQKESFNDWSKSIEILCDWNVINSEQIRNKYEELRDIRHGVIHFNKLEDIEVKAIIALRIIYDITAYFFAVGNRKDIYFWCPGEIYVKNEAEQIPFVKEMILPHCYLVGHGHRIESVNRQNVLRDDSVYEEKEISDEEFTELRKSLRR